MRLSDGGDERGEAAPSKGRDRRLRLWYLSGGTLGISTWWLTQAGEVSGIDFVRIADSSRRGVDDCRTRKGGAVRRPPAVFLQRVRGGPR